MQRAVQQIKAIDSLAFQRQQSTGMKKSDFDVALAKRTDLAFERLVRQLNDVNALHFEVVPKLKEKVAREEAARRNKYIVAVVVALVVVAWMASRIPWGVASYMHTNDERAL